MCLSNSPKPEMYYCPDCKEKIAAKYWPTHKEFFGHDRPEVVKKDVAASEIEDVE